MEITAQLSAEQITERVIESGLPVGERPALGRRARLAIAVSLLLVAAGCAVFGVAAIVDALQRWAAAEMFETGAEERGAWYETHTGAVEQGQPAGPALTADYPSVIAIATTVTDNTVADSAD